MPPSDPIPSSLDPDTLIERCLQGDQQAWEQIVRQYWRRVFNVAYKFVGRHDEAEDLTQDIFLKIFKSLATFDRRANFQTWLVSVSRNLCIDHYRSVRKERETIDRDVNADDLSPASVEISAHVALERDDLAQELRARAAAAARDAADGGRHARHPGAVVPGNRRPAAPAGRDRQVADQPRPARTGPADHASAEAKGPGPQADAGHARPSFWSMSMNLTIDHVRDIAVVRVAESRLMYPLLVRFLDRRHGA